MEVGIITKYGKLVPGREQQAIELFNETKLFLEEQFKTGYITSFEPFFYTTGDLDVEVGFWLIKGERDKILKVMDTDTFRWLMLKAQFLVEHLKVEWLLVGDEITHQIERAAKIATEYEFVH